MLKVKNISRLFVGLFCAFFLAQAQSFAAVPSDAQEVISANNLRELQLKKTKIIIYDARDKISYDQGHIQGAVLPLDTDYYRELALFQSGVIPKGPDADKALGVAMKKVPKNARIVTYCNANCGASKVLQLKLVNLGFTDVRVMAEGYQVWESKGYPVVKK